MPQYATVQFVRDEGKIPATVINATIESSIKLYSQLISDHCQVSFEATSKVKYVDGNGKDIIFLDEPIVEVTALRMNNELEDTDSVIDVDDYYVETNPHNPKIQLKKSKNSIYSVGTTSFYLGKRNQRVDGVFGWVEDDGQGNLVAPIVIQHAVARLVGIKLASPFSNKLDPMNELRTDVIEEWTDGHRLRFRNRKTDGYSITDPLVLSWLRKYRKPTGMRVIGASYA